MINQGLLDKARENDIAAMLALAVAYYHGEDGEENQYKAFELYQKVLSLEPNNVIALNDMGNCFDNGIGTEVDPEKAKEYYTKAAELDFPNAQYNLAVCLKEKNDPECLKWYQKAFENGDIDAPYQIAQIYQDGEIIAVSYNKAIEYLEYAVNMGNTDAMIDLAVAYFRGEMVAQDKNKGIQLMTKAAEAGNGTAANNLSILYEKGDGVKADINLAIDWAKKAAELGEGEQIFSFGVSYFDGNGPLAEDKEKALEYFELAAGCDSPAAMENVGICYYKGHGTAVDIEKAIDWFEKAARLGSEKGINNLRTLYNEKYGESGKEKYVQILTETANDGYYIAMVKLHDCYIDGYGVKQDIKTALEWLDSAVEGEFPLACLKKGLYHINGQYGVEIDASTAAHLMTIAAEGGIEEACYNLGMFYKDGFGVSRNYEEAAKWFALAVEANDTQAMLILSSFYLEGSGVQKDEEKGIELLQRAADLSDTSAMFRLGVYFFNGAYGLEQDREKAILYWKKGDEAGDCDCSKNLGLCYKDGRGVTQNHELSIAFFERAATQGSVEAMLQLGLAYDDNGIALTDYNKALQYYEKAQDAGSAPAMFCLGTMYETGRGVPKDEVKALEHYLRASEKGHARASLQAGIFYHEGIGTDKNIGKSAEYFERAKALGEPDAEKLLAVLYTHELDAEGIDLAKAFEFNIKKAEEGDPEAQYCVFRAYQKGEGVKEDHDEAEVWLRRAADNGHPASQYTVGLLELVLDDHVSACIDYWEKASKGGYLKATHELAELYLNGDHGVQVNKPRAIELLTEAAKSGYPDSQSTLGICYATGNGVERNDDRALLLFEKAAEQGDQYAQKNLAIFYREGRGIGVDKLQAAQWFEKAAVQGNNQARLCLARMYSEGEGVPVDYSKAETLYNEVITDGDSEYLGEAVFSLADLYASKLKDYNKAIPLWKKATDGGNTAAKYNLGISYYNGFGVPKDDTQALYWFRQAASEGDRDAQEKVRTLEEELRKRTATPGSGSYVGGSNPPINPKPGAKQGNHSLLILCLVVIGTLMIGLLVRGCNDNKKDSSDERTQQYPDYYEGTVQGSDSYIDDRVYGPSTQGIGSFVADGADLLSPEAEQYIANVNAFLQTKCEGAVFPVITVESLGDESPAFYMEQAFRIGEREHANFLCLLISKEEKWQDKSTFIELDFCSEIETAIDWIDLSHWEEYYLPETLEDEEYERGVIDLITYEIIPLYSNYYGVSFDDFIAGNTSSDYNDIVDNSTVPYSLETIGDYTGAMGTMFYVPAGFEQYDPGPVNGYMYCFYNADLRMNITVSEISFASIDITTSPEDLISADYWYYKNAYGDSVTYSNSDYYVLSGYSNDETIFYKRLYNYDPTYVTVDFQYPAASKEYCDPLLIDFLSTVYNAGGCNPELLPNGPMPGPDDLQGCNEQVAYPDDDCWIGSYETKYLKTRHGVRAYLRYGPYEDSGYYSYVYEQAEVTVLARQNGYSLVKTTDGNAGWVTSALLVDSYY